MEQNMMFLLHQPGGRNLRPKGFQLNKAFQVALLLAICILLTYYLIKLSDYKPKSNGHNTQSKLRKEYKSILFGRKGIVFRAVINNTIVRNGSNGLEDNIEGRSKDGDNNEIRRRLEGVHDEFPGDAEQDFPGNGMGTLWEKDVNQVRKGDEMDRERDVVKEKVKIEVRNSIQAGEIADQGGYIESGFQSFEDENGVPPEDLNILNSNFLESINHS